MADNDDIVQNVKINVESDGVDNAFDELKAALGDAFAAIKEAFSSFDLGDAWAKIKDAGAKAFEALKQIGSDSLQGLAQAAERNAEAIGSAVLAIGAAVAAVGVALALAGRAMYSFVQSTSQAVNAMGELADRTQTAIQVVSSLQSFFAEAGVGPKEFEDAYRHLGNTVSETWASIKKEVTEGADKVTQTHLAAAQAALRLQDAQRELRNTGRDLAKQQRDDANSVADAQRRVEQAQIALDKSNGINTTQREKILAQQKLETDATRAQQSLQDAQQKQRDDANKADEEVVKRQLAVKQAQLAADQSQRASRSADRNDLGNITRSVQSLASGNQDALRNFNSTADNILKGVVASAAESGAAIRNLGVDFSGLADTGPKVKDVLLQLGLVLNNINDPILRNQVAFKALGNASQDFINALRTGGIDEFIAKMGVLGGAVDSVDKKVASDFINSLTRLQDTLGNIGVKIATAFGPTFTAVLDNLNSAFDRSRDNIVRFAETVATVVGPPFKAISASINVVAQVANTLIDIFRNVSELIKAAFGLSDVPIQKTLERLYNILKAIAEIITGDLKKGIEDLKKESAKELQETFKKPAPETAKRDEQGFPVGLTQAEKDRVNFNAARNEAAAAAARGLPPEPPPQPSVLERLDPRAALERLFGGGAAAPPAAPVAQPEQQQQTSTLDRLSGIVESLKQNLDSHFQGQQPQSQQPAQQQQTPPQQQPAAQPEPSAIQSFFDKISGFLNSFNKPETNVSPEDSSSGIGIRGSLDDASSGLKNVATAADAPLQPLQQLAAAAGAAATQLASVKSANVSSDGKSATVSAATGGLIRGPGTGTSDSININVSDGEFVMRSDAVRRVGVGFLHALNRGVRGFAGGGLINPDGSVSGSYSNDPTSSTDPIGRSLANASTLGPGQHDIAFDPQSGGAFIDGILHTPPDPILNDPVVRRAIEESKQGMRDQQKKTAHSGFTGQFGFDGPTSADAVGHAGGGHINGPGSETSDSIPAWLSKNEFVQPARATRHYGIAFMESIRNLSFPRFNVPHFNLGGLVSPQVPRFRFADGGPVVTASGPSALPNLGTLNLRTDYGDAVVYGDKTTVSDLRRAAVTKNIGSQKKSSWRG